MSSVLGSLELESTDARRFITAAFQEGGTGQVAKATLPVATRKSAASWNAANAASSSAAAAAAVSAAPNTPSQKPERGNRSTSPNPASRLRPRARPVPRAGNSSNGPVLAPHQCGFPDPDLDLMWGEHGDRITVRGSSDGRVRTVTFKWPLEEPGVPLNQRRPLFLNFDLEVAC